jgi:hypothetical protein
VLAFDSTECVDHLFAILIKQIIHTIAHSMYRVWTAAQSAQTSIQKKMSGAMQHVLLARAHLYVRRHPWPLRSATS